MAVLIPKLVPFLLVNLIGIPIALATPVRTMDGLGQTVRLNAPAQRIVSLAPNVTELVYAAGAGSHLVAVSSYSDWPAAARNLPRVGDAFRIDLERIVALKPDLVIGWASGTSPSERQALQRLGLPLMLVASRKLDDIARSIRRIGRLAGTAVVADRAADAFVATQKRLARTYAHRRPLSVFYEISGHPLYTVGGRQIISQVLNLCGGRNVFSDLGKLAPVVSRGAVLARKPQVILVGSGPGAQAALDAWKRWTWLPAVRQGNLFLVPATMLGQATPRLLQGALTVCRDLQQARQRIYPASHP